MEGECWYRIEDKSGGVSYRMMTPSTAKAYPSAFRLDFESAITLLESLVAGEKPGETIKVEVPIH